MRHLNVLQRLEEIIPILLNSNKVKDSRKKMLSKTYSLLIDLSSLKKKLVRQIVNSVKSDNYCNAITIAHLAAEIYKEVLLLTMV